MTTGMNNQVLIISLWNPTPLLPQQGIFIQEHATAVSNLTHNIVFLQINILPSGSLKIKQTIEQFPLCNNRRIVVNIYSRFWKFIYMNPWWITNIISHIIKKPELLIDPEIINSNVIFPCGIAGYLLAKKMGVKHIITEHWTKTERVFKNPLYKRIAINSYRSSFAVITVSKYLSHKISDSTGVKNIAVIPNIIDPKIFSYLPKASSSEKSLTFMCIASWRPPKRLDLIYYSLCEFAKEIRTPVILKVVGKGSQVDSLRNSYRPANLNVEWLGYLDKQSIAEHLQSTHIFMMASDIETFSVVTAEALSTGTPVLASNNSALPELVGNHNGILVENTIGDWLNGIRKIVATQFDHEDISLRVQNKFSYETVGKKILDIYTRGFNSL